MPGSAYPPAMAGKDSSTHESIRQLPTPCLQEDMPFVNQNALDCTDVTSSHHAGGIALRYADGEIDTLVPDFLSLTQ